MRKECTLYLNFGDFDAKVLVEYWYTPADPGVRYYPDGSGCPPTGPDIEVTELVVYSITTRSEQVLTAQWLHDRGWYLMALKAVWDRFDNAFEPESSIWFDLLEDATNE